MTTPHRKGEFDLSPREIEIVALIASGKAAKEIAVTIGVSWKTVVSHISAIHHKTGTHKAVELAAFALNRGLIQTGYQQRLMLIQTAAEPVRIWMGTIDSFCMASDPREKIEGLLKTIEEPRP